MDGVDLDGMLLAALARETLLADLRGPVSVSARDAELQRDAERISAGWQMGRRAERGETLLAEYLEGSRQLAESRNRPQGFWPDGTPVSDSEKRAIYAEYERVRDAHRRGAGRQPVYASASPDGGPSPLIRHMFALD